ncbi:MAG: hypothetical protein WDN24_15225 [Sphingomonas sp.]
MAAASRSAPVHAEAPPPDWDDRVRAPAASRFNQYGFFAAGSPEGAGPAAAPPAPSAEAARESAPAPPTAAAEAHRGPAGTPAETRGGSPSRVDPGHAPRAGVAAAAAAAAPGFRGAVAAAPSAPAGPAGTADPARERPGAAPRAAIQRLRQRAAESARTPIEVAVREMEHGLAVTARVEALDRRERSRLHDAIAALLARHGLAAHAIRIAVSSAPSSQGEA